MASRPSDNKPILALIAILLMAILGLMIYQVTKPTPEERAADAISNVVEDIGNTFDKKD